MLKGLLTGLLALVFFTGAAYAEDAVCNAAPYNMESCPNDIHDFLTRLKACHEGKVTEDCGLLGCQYADLLRKYKGQQMPIHLIQDTAKHITGSDYHQACDMTK